MSEASETGAITWADLTVPNAEEVRDFYAAVVGWQANDHDMGGYNDYDMCSPESGEVKAGICWARGDNADQPPQWLVYLTVQDLDASVAQVEAKGGKVLRPPRDMGGYGRVCVIQDPAGAVASLYEPKS